MYIRLERHPTLIYGENSGWLMMDSRVVVHEGPRIVTISLARRSSRRPDLPPHPASEAWTDGEHPRPLRRRQMLPDDPGDAVARRRDLPSLLLGLGHQERPG